MREICTSGSEGGGAGINRPFLPLSFRRPASYTTHATGPRRLCGRTDHEQPVVTESGLRATGAVTGCRLGTEPQSWPRLRLGIVPG